MSIGRHIAEALTSQFYDWEIRGRGWLLADEPISIEPPFRRFEGHFLPARLVEDDGQIESAGSRFAKGLGRLLGVWGGEALPEVPSEPEDPDFEAPEPSEDLVELQLSLPKGFEPSASVFEQFLVSIGYSEFPVAFEIVGTGEELVVQVTAATSDAGAVEAQLRAFFPEAVVVIAQGALRRILSEDSDSAFEVVDFGLGREFMVPLNTLKGIATDPLVAICGALEGLGEGEASVLQVLTRPVRHSWADSMLRAVSLGDGKPFFANDGEILAQARTKLAKPLYAVLVRVLAKAGSRERVDEIVRSVAGGLRPLASVSGNRLIPLRNDGYDLETHAEDVWRRETHRTGMILNSDELIAIAHLPMAAVRAKSLRRVLRTTKAAPEHLQVPSGARIGVNEHEGVSRPVFLPNQLRLNHCHVLGGTGSGKSTLLALLAAEDIKAGRGVAVIDPHGDLIDRHPPHYWTALHIRKRSFLQARCQAAQGGRGKH